MILRFLGSILVILSGLLFISDQLVELFDIEIQNTHGFNSPANFAFFIGTWIGIIILIIAFKLKPFTLSFVVPIYNVSLSLYWVFFTNEYTNKSFFNGYIIVSTIAIILILSYISAMYNKYQKSQADKKERIKLLEAVLDLSILKTRKEIEAKNQK